MKESKVINELKKFPKKLCIDKCELLYSEMKKQMMKFPISFSSFVDSLSKQVEARKIQGIQSTNSPCI